MTSTFTCITCHVAFKDLEIQRQHYKSDWHRYNLKRKVAELPPVTAEEFQKRVIAQRSKDDRENQEKNVRCGVCRKTFNTKNQYDNHLLSKKHKENVLKYGECERKTYEDGDGKETVKSKPPETMDVDSEVESIDSDEWIEDSDNPVKNNDCLFCAHHSRSLLRNLKHMTMAHSFFVPDLEYCVDLQGLLLYLGEKIFAGYMCIWCNESGKAFQSAEAARAHMIDKGHCKMLHEGEALVEYADFYDYSSSYPDGENADADEEVDIPQLDDSDYQLVLPSGIAIGHRSLMRYYKQSLNPNRAVATSKSDKIRRIMSEYRALGWSGSDKEAVAKKARDIKYMQRIRNKYSTKLQFKANKLQKHFRQQVNF